MTGRASWPVDAEVVLRSARVGGSTDLVRPHDQWGLDRIADVIVGSFGTGGFLTTGREDTLIVLAVDAVGVEPAWHLASTGRTALTSTFPSTSVVAWRSALTGRPMRDHAVPGVVYREPPGVSYHSFRDKMLFTGDDWAEAPAATDHVDLPHVPGVFERLAAAGVHCVALPGPLLAIPSRWQDSLLAGAHVAGSVGTPDAAPGTVVAEGVAAVSATLRNRPAGRPLLVWCWLNLDDAVHVEGYSRRVRAALSGLAAAAEAWSAEGHAVLLHSDHGMTRCRSSADLDAQWQAVNERLCSLPPGGAGRVRWCYPAPGRAREFRERLTVILGRDALVASPDELAGLGLLPVEDPTVGGRIGEVVALAVGSAFPSAMTAEYEHGGASADEMIVPVLWWQA